MSLFSVLIFLLSGLPKAFLFFFVSTFTPYTAVSSLPFSSLLIFALVPINIKRFIVLTLPCFCVISITFILNLLQVGLSRDMVFFYIAISSNLFLFVQSCLLRASFYDVGLTRILSNIFFLLVVQSLGYLLTPTSISSQLFSGQFVPIASLTLLTYLTDFQGIYKLSFKTYFFLTILSIFFFVFIQARSTLVIFLVTFLLSALFLLLARFKGLNLFTNYLWKLLFPTKFFNIVVSISLIFFLYSAFNLSFFNTFFGGSIPEVSSFISNAESCDYYKIENCDSDIDSVPTNDVSILVRTVSDYVFLDSLIKSPLSFIFPLRIHQNTKTANYKYRTHNMLIFWIQNFGLLGILSLFYTFYLADKFLTSRFPLYLSPLALPIITLSLFTLNDFFILLPFTIYLPYSFNHE